LERAGLRTIDLSLPDSHDQAIVEGIGALTKKAILEDGFPVPHNLLGLAWATSQAIQPSSISALEY